MRHPQPPYLSPAHVLTHFDTWSTIAAWRHNDAAQSTSSARRKTTAARPHARTPPLPADRAALAARRFKALGDATRLGILATLAANADPVCACDLGGDVALGQPTVAHHLKVLRDAGLVVAERRGKWAHYRLHPAAATWVRTVLTALPDAPEGER